MNMPYPIRGMVALLVFVSSAWSLHAAGELPAVAGYLNNDTSPAAGAVSVWGGSASVAVDYSRRSVALDFGSAKKVHTIRLRDSNDSSRVVSGDQTVWYSNDNVTYALASGWNLTSQTVDGRLIHSLRGPAITARYVKINTSFADTAYTFVVSRLQEDFRAQSVIVGLLNTDPTPATGAVTSWGSTGSVALDYQRRSVVLDFSTVQRVRHVRLRDNNGTTRLVAENYTLWRSNDNVTYTEVTGWSLIPAVRDGRVVHTFVGFDVEARYLKVNTTFADTAHTFVLSNLQDEISAWVPHEQELGLALHSDGDRLFPPGAGNLGEAALTARDAIVAEVNAIADAGFTTLKMGIGTDVLNWPSIAGSSRDWRIDDPTWALSSAEWATYADLRGRAHTARNLFTAGIDPVAVAATQARLRGMRFILSYRMADTHFAVNPAAFPLTCAFYLNREASAVAAEKVAISHDGTSPMPGYVNFNRLMNFDRTDVRTYRLGVLFEALDRYKDVADGLELEFTRSLALFPFGEGAAKTGLVSDFIQDVRDKIDELAATSPRLKLGLRVPWPQSVNSNQGLDVDAQLASRRVDYVVASNVMTVAHDMDVREWVAATRPAHVFDPGVAIHGGMAARKPSGWSFPASYGSASAYALSTSAENEQLLGAALGFKQMGADAPEIYNFAGLVASAGGRTRLGWLATNLNYAADTSAQKRIFAVTPRHAKPYEGRSEFVKRLPAEFRSNGTVWANTVDGALLQQGSAQHVSSLFVVGAEGRAANETWLFRVGLRALAGQPIDWNTLSLRIVLNGTDVLWNGPISSAPAVLVAVGDPLAPPAFPAPTHYVTLPIPVNFPLKDANFNTVTIEQNSVTGGPFGFGLQEIQIGVLP